jgi:hypothetical protein
MLPISPYRAPRAPIGGSCAALSCGRVAAVPHATNRRLIPAHKENPHEAGRTKKFQEAQVSKEAPGYEEVHGGKEIKERDSVKNRRLARAKQLSETELRRQAVQALSDSLGLALTGSFEVGYRSSQCLRS